MKKMLWLVLVLLSLDLRVIAANGFFEQRHRGWLWFNEREVAEGANHVSEQEQQIALQQLQEQAKLENEIFAAELEDMKHLAIRYPENIDYVTRYKRMEKVMYDNAARLGKSWVMTNFLNPDLGDELENPKNIYGREAKKDLDLIEMKANLQHLASKLDIFVFRQDGCIYCSILEKHLAHFARQYNFAVEAVSADGSNSSVFKTHHAPAMIQALELNVMPVVIAVVKDTRQRFELARGAVSVADLEDKALLLFEHLKLPRHTQDLQSKVKKNLDQNPQENPGGCTACQLR
jgi:thioredoxin-related protein